MRAALGKAEYRVDNIALRNAARPLTAVRDATFSVVGEFEEAEWAVDARCTAQPYAQA